MAKKELNSRNKQQLVKLANHKKIKNYSWMTKAELITQLSQKKATPKAKSKAPIHTAHTVFPRKQGKEKPLMQEQEKIEEAKYYMGPAEYQIVEQAADLPPGYGRAA